MENRIDFLNRLDSDTPIKILMCLDDPADLVRVCCVSRSWRHYVITNGLCKQLCLRMFPQLVRVARVVELNEDTEVESRAKKHTKVGSSYSMEQLALERDHRIYAYLARASTSAVSMNCIFKTIGASSTDNFPQESIDNTLEPRENYGGRYFYWSSNGQSNPNVPETLTYKLISQICVITEINIQPFQGALISQKLYDWPIYPTFLLTILCVTCPAYFQNGSPIYSAKSVRFKMGHPKTSLDHSADEEFVWTYTSPEFPMAQENRLQKFELPEPVLCIGGILQIELLGRVQRQEMDDLLYICVSYVQVIGRSLSPAFSVEILEPSGMFVLKRDQLASCQFLPTSDSDVPQIATILGEEHLVGVLEYDWDENEYEVDDFEEGYAL